MPSVPVPSIQTGRRYWLLAAASILAGCGNLNSIHRPLYAASGTGALIDAKQRAIIVSQRTDNNTPRYVACAEPSPDAMSAYAAQFAAELSKTSTDGANYAAGVKSALQEAAAHIGMRTPSIQLLRDAMYRVCEAYANAGIDSGQYELLMRRYQRQIVAMMAIEQLTQAGRVPPITLATASGVNSTRPLSEWTSEIRNQQTLLAKQQDTAAKAEANRQKAVEALEKNANASQAQADKAAAEVASAAALAEAAKTKSIIAMLEKGALGDTALAGSSATYVASAVSSESTARQIADVQYTVKELAMKVLQTDDTGALCFEHLKQNNSAPALVAMCNAHMDVVQEANMALAAYYKSCRNEGARSQEALTSCLEKAPSLRSPVPAVMMIPPS